MGSPTEHKHEEKKPAEEGNEDEPWALSAGSAHRSPLRPSSHHGGSTASNQFSKDGERADSHFQRRGATSIQDALMNLKNKDATKRSQSTPAPRVGLEELRTVERISPFVDDEPETLSETGEESTETLAETREEASETPPKEKSEPPPDAAAAAEAAASPVEHAGIPEEPPDSLVELRSSTIASSAAKAVSTPKRKYMLREIGSGSSGWGAK